MQNRQYYLNPYQVDYQTRVVSAAKIQDNYHVVLENTIFYPEGGGQPADTGFIENIPVLDVYEQQGVVYHVLPTAPQNNPVNCRIDWDRRFYHMQHHTGQHLLSAAFFREFGWQTWGFHLSDEYSTLDITAGELPSAIIREAELKINRLIQADKAINTYFITDLAEVDPKLLRKEPQVNSEIRIVEIAGYDAVPCCGTHLSSTGQVGLLKIMKTEKIRNMTRIYYRCGERALIDYQDKFDAVSKLALMFSSAEQDVLERVAAELEAKRTAEQELKKVKQQLLAYLAEDLTKQSNGSIIVHHLDSGEEPETAQLLIREVLALGNYLVLAEVNNRVFLSHNLTSDLNCGEIVKEYGIPLGGKGGGKKDFAQIFFADRAKLQEFITVVKSIT